MQKAFLFFLCFSALVANQQLGPEALWVALRAKSFEEQEPCKEQESCQEQEPIEDQESFEAFVRLMKEKAAEEERKKEFHKSFRTSLNHLRRLRLKNAVLKQFLVSCCAQAAFPVYLSDFFCRIDAEFFKDLESQEDCFEDCFVDLSLIHISEPTRPY